MNLQEHLLVCLNEESAEFSQELCKCLRFSAQHIPVGIYTTSNIERAELEFADMCAIADLLKIRCNLDLGFPRLFDLKPNQQQRFREKQARTLQGMQFAEQLDTLQTLEEYLP